MPKRIFVMLLAIVAGLGLFAANASAYVDPGTAQAVFSSLAPVLAAIGSVIVVALWPIRMLYRWARHLPWFVQIGVYLGAVSALTAVCWAVVYFVFIASYARPACIR